MPQTRLALRPETPRSFLQHRPPRANVVAGEVGEVGAKSAAPRFEEEEEEREVLSASAPGRGTYIQVPCLDSRLVGDMGL